jgi:hypothetical protein
VAKKRTLAKVQAGVASTGFDALLGDLRELIGDARRQTAQAVNAALTLTYWRVGDRIRREILKEKRADYAEKVLPRLSRQLEQEFGQGFGEKNLRRMVQFAEVYPDEQIVVALIRQLTWTHFIALIPLKDRLQRDFYAEMCRLERWSVRTLRERIQSMLYERTAISKSPPAVDGDQRLVYLPVLRFDSDFPSKCCPVDIGKNQVHLITIDESDKETQEFQPWRSAEQVAGNLFKGLG